MFALSAENGKRTLYEENEGGGKSMGKLKNEPIFEKFLFFSMENKKKLNIFLKY